MKSWIRRRLRRFLGVVDCDDRLDIIEHDAASLEKTLSRHMEAGVEVGLQGNTRIVVLSTLGGGRCEVISCNMANPQEITEMLARLYYHPEVSFVDAPIGMEREMKRQAEQFM